MYKPFCENPNLLIGTGIPVVIVGWTKLEKVTKVLNSDFYACLGNLHSPTRGISHIVRNLLANPQYNAIYLLGVTPQDENSGSMRCFIDFINNGVKGKTEDGRYYCIDSEVVGYIESVIPLADILQLRERLIVHICTSLDELKLKCEKHESKLLSGYEPLVYPVDEIKTETYPNDIYSHTISAENIVDAWVILLHRIRKYGHIRKNMHGSYWQELINLKVVTDDPLTGKIPDYAPVNREFLENYSNEIVTGNISSGVKYTYGSRLRSHFGHDQVKILINKLIKEPDAASAVMNLWDVEDNFHGGSPCLTNIWCRITDNHMSLTATLRSNDMFGAWVANAWGLRALQKHIIEEINKQSNLNLKISKLTTISQSAHLYNDCWEWTDKVVSQNYHRLVRNNFNDPIGSFVISYYDDTVTVEQISPGSGIPTKKYTGKSVDKLISTIIEDNPVIQPSHAAYLMREITKCVHCRNSGKTYQQDE